MKWWRNTHREKMKKDSRQLVCHYQSIFQIIHTLRLLTSFKRNKRKRKTNPKPIILRSRYCDRGLVHFTNLLFAHANACIHFSVSRNFPILIVWKIDCFDSNSSYMWAGDSSWVIKISTSYISNNWQSFVLDLIEVAEVCISYPWQFV